MSLSHQINYKQLLQRHNYIRVPIIQRDYAQGREDETEVREEFLKTLKEALLKPVGDPTLPLNLDFIYGSVEGDEQTRFLPLDGQQRLTTLFLLHWYLAWKDDQWPDFEQLFLAEGHSRFAYSVRPSSNDFFDQLVSYHPSVPPEQVTKLSVLIADQPWYFRSWRLDPTIQAVLNMLDVIHQKFSDTNGLFTKLFDETQPFITFQLLDMENFTLSDDLYIKMNARGMPLTAFETFKARYEQVLKGQFLGTTFLSGDQSFPVSDYVARRIDTTWADLFWKLRNKKNDLYDEAFMNVFRAVALITRDLDADDYLEDVSDLRTGYNPPSYRDFHSRNWLDERFTRTVICLLDAWSANNGDFHRLLPSTRYFDEKAFFTKIVSDGADLTYTELVQLAAYAEFIVKQDDKEIDPDAFQGWMRIIQNLAVNTVYNRPDDFRRSIAGIAGLLEYSDGILQHFAQDEKPASGFNEQQVVEEKLKAQLILAHEDWREHIDRAENHGYFRGQIEFLLDFSGAVDKSEDAEPKDWGTLEHTALLTAFDKYWCVAEKMFSGRGLIDCGKYRWQRALLCMGNYLLPKDRNRSFLVNPATLETSWKRLLRGTGYNVSEARIVLKTLWEKLSPERDISQQLDTIIEPPSKDLDPWREAIVQCPEVFSYCESSFLRWEYSGIYLLKRSRMNGYHAELFTYYLYHKLKAREIDLKHFNASYVYVVGNWSEPGVQLTCKLQRIAMTVTIENRNADYLVMSAKPQNDKNEIFKNIFKTAGFSEGDNYFLLRKSRSEIDEWLKKLDDTLNSYLEGNDEWLNNLDQKG